MYHKYSCIIYFILLDMCGRHKRTDAPSVWRPFMDTQKDEAIGHRRRCEVNPQCHVICRTSDNT